MLVGIFFLFPIQRGRLLRFQKQITKQTQILSSKHPQTIPPTTAWCFLQCVLHDVPSRLFIGGISFHILAASANDVHRGKEQTHTQTHTWSISGFINSL